MRILKIVIIVAVAVILILVTLTILTSRGFSQIIDLIHKDTQKFYKDYNISDTSLNNYVINGVIFLPYTNHNPEQSYDQKYSTYSLSLASYRQKGNSSKVTVNNVMIEEIQNAKFNKITKTVSESLDFKNDEKHENIQVNIMPMIDEINNYDMGLTDKSQIKVVLNVSVEENGKITTRDLEYIFETKIRKYLNQR